MKKFISGFIVGMILMCAVPSLAKTDAVQAIYNNIKVVVNGETVTFAKGEEPVTINSRTYVPAKYVAEALGATVKWDGTSSTVNITGATTKTTVEPSVPSTTPSSDTVKNEVVPTIKDPLEDRSGKMNLATEKTSDGLYIYTFNKEPQKYVLSNELNVYISKVKFGITRGALFNSDSRALKNADGSKDLIADLEYYVMNGMEYFTLDYYENTMLPIIKAEGN